MADLDGYLKWDGLCLPQTKITKVETAEAELWWCNSRDIVPKTAPPAAEKKPPSMVTQSFGSGSSVVLSQQRAWVSLISVDPTFAPSGEYALIHINIKNVEKAGCMVLQIRDSADKVVYAERLTQGQIWGLPTKESDATATKPRLALTDSDSPTERAKKLKERSELTWASPTGSPYTVSIVLTGIAKTTPNQAGGSPDLLVRVNRKTLRPSDDPQINSVPPADSSATQQPDQTSVRAHSIALEMMKWADLYMLLSQQANADYPDAQSESVKTMWVQHKLNELGHFAGPVDGKADNPDLKKAIIRYRQADKDLYVKRYKKADGEFIFHLDGAAALDDTITPALVDKLKSGAGSRKVIDDEKVFTGEKAAGKLYVDLDRLMQDAIAEFKSAPQTAGITEKAKMEAAWYSTPRIPLRVKVFVTNRAGEKTESVATVPVTWSWTDETLDLSTLPAHSTPEPSRTKDYLTKAIKSIADRIPSEYNNTRKVFGGQITGDKLQDRQAVFEQIGGFEMKKGGTSDTWGVSTPGAVYFTPSLIGGDNYKIKAAAGSLSAVTGKLEVWRRISIACHIAWSADPPSGVWDAVGREYKQAFIELVPPARSVQFSAIADKTFKDEFEAAQTRLGFESTDIKVDNDAFDPRDLSSKLTCTWATATDINQRMRAALDANGALTAWENSGTQNAVPNEFKAAETLRDLWRGGQDSAVVGIPPDKKCQLLLQAYQFFIKELPRIKGVQAPPDDDAPQDIKALVGITRDMKMNKWKKENTRTVFKNITNVADRKLKPFVPDDAVLNKFKKSIVDDLVKKCVIADHTLTEVLLSFRRIVGPGLLIVEIDPHKPVTIGAEQYLTPNVPSLYPGGEAVLFSRAMYTMYKPFHLFGHEMAHTQFLQHHKNANPYVAYDHDQLDENCMMSYAYEEGKQDQFLPGIGDHYKGGSYTPHFCGKCNLQMRGWNIRAKDPDAKTLDLLPHVSAIEPLPRVKLIKQPVEVVSPSLLHVAAEELMGELLGETDFKKYWIRPGGLGGVGCAGAVGNPHVGPDAVRWDLVPMISVPEGTALSQPDLSQLTEEEREGVFHWPHQPGLGLIRYWAETTANTLNPFVQLNVHSPWYTFTDYLHESCHSFQKWAPPIYFFEGFTELFAAILVRKVRRLVERSKAPRAQEIAGRLNAYDFNPAYAECTMVTIDHWLPRLGLPVMGQIYVKGEEKPFDDLYAAGSGPHAEQIKNLFRSTGLHLRPGPFKTVTKFASTDPIAATSVGKFREDVEAAVVASGPLEDDLRAAIRSFLKFLAEQAAGFSTELKGHLLTGKSGLELSYAQARAARWKYRQVTYGMIYRELNVLKEKLAQPNTFFLGGDAAQIDTDINTYRDELTAVTQPTGESIDNLLLKLPAAPFQGQDLLPSSKRFVR